MDKSLITLADFMCWFFSLSQLVLMFSQLVLLMMLKAMNTTSVPGYARCRTWA